MAIIGNTVTSVPFIADSFSGNASTTSFSPLTRAPAGTAAIAVFIAGVYQAPGAYTLSGTTITFVSAPASGVGNIIVLHLGNGSATQVTSDGSVTLTKLSGDTFSYINTAFTTANSSGSYANAAFATANTGTASGSYANSAFATANTGTAAGSYANSAFSVANNGVGIDATQNTNITSAGAYANAAFATANTGSASGSYANSAFATANTASTNATNAGTYANSAFTKANTAGAGTVTSVATGNGLSGGTITSTGTLVVACPTHNSIGSYCVGGTVVSGTSGSFAFGTNYSAGSGNGQIQVVSRRVYNDPCTGPATREPVYANSLSGSWKCMGAGVSFTSGNGATSLFCRVS